MDITSEQVAISGEASKIKSLIGLAEDSGIDPGLSITEVDLIVELYNQSLPDVDKLAFKSALSRIRDMHRHLHELLYAPPRR